MRKYTKWRVSVLDIKNKVNIEKIPSSTLHYIRKRLGIKASASHKNKAKIMKALLDEKKWKDIQNEFGCSSSTIGRYKNSAEFKEMKLQKKND